MHGARIPNLPITPNCLDACVTSLLIQHLPTFKGRVRDRGKAVADSATDGEGAECEKIASLDCRESEESG